MTGVAGFQIYLSQSDTLTQWKGGGFGMYTSVHPTFNKVTFNDSLVSLNSKANVSDKVFQEAYHRFLLYPNQKTLASFIHHTNYNNRDSLNVKIYDLRFNISNHNATYAKVIFECTYNKG